MKGIKITAIVDLIIMMLSACAVDSATPIPLVVCVISSFCMIPLAIMLKDSED